MHGWIRDIELKIQDFRGPPKVTLLPLNLTKTKYSSPLSLCVLGGEMKTLINADDVFVFLIAGFI